MPRSRGLLSNALEFSRGGLLGLTTDVLGAPVDLATMAMRPFGYDVPQDQIVGSSDWIASKIGAAPSGSGAETAGRLAGGFATPGGLAKGAALASPFLLAKLSPSARSAAELASHPDAFKYAISKAEDFPAAMRQIAPEMDVAKRNIGGFTQEGYEITTSAGNKAFVFLNKDGTVELDISNFRGGKGGSAVYQAVGDWAANRGHRFIGDTSGLSPIAQIRRTPNMLSSALRHGSTAHLEPHPLQMTPEVEGVQPLSWRPGDDAYNVSQLADSYVKTYQNLVPEISRIRYNSQVGRFEDGAGNAVTDEDFFELVKLGRGRDLPLADVPRGMDRTPPIGRNDLKRVALLQSGVRSLHGRGLAQPGRELPQRDPSLHPALRGLLYGVTGALPVVGLLGAAQDDHAP